MIIEKGLRKGEELKAPCYASAAATRDYITACGIIPNKNYLKVKTVVFKYLIILFSVKNSPSIF